MAVEETPEQTPAEEPKRFDLMAALAGRTYPEKKVTVFLDEALMYLRNEVEEAHLHDPANKDLEALVEKTREELAPLALTVTVKGAPPHLLKSLIKSVNDDFPPKKNAFGGVELPDGYGDAFDQRMWELLVVNISDAEGNGSTPSPEEIEEFRKVAPAASIKAVDDAIEELSDNSRTGYHLAIQDLGFLSQP